MALPHSEAVAEDNSLPQLILPSIADCPESNPVREIVTVAGIGKNYLQTNCWTLEAFQERTDFNTMIQRASSELSPKEFQKLSNTYNNAFAEAKVFLRYSKFTVYSKCIPWTFSSKNKTYSGQSCIYNNNFAKNPQYLIDFELANKLFDNAWETAISVGRQNAVLTCIEWEMPYESQWFDNGKACYYPEKSRKRISTNLDDAVQKAFSDEVEQNVVQDVVSWFVTQIPAGTSEPLIKLNFFPKLKWLDVQVSTVSSETCRIDRANSILKSLKKGSCDLFVKLQNEEEESFTFNLPLNFK